MAPDQTRVGLSYFSGTCSCGNTFNGNSVVGCSGGCGRCGGLWDTKFVGMSSNKDYVLGLSNAQSLQGGCTCISCGLQEGERALNVNVRPGVPRTLVLFTDGQQNYAYDFTNTIAARIRNSGITIVAVGVNGFDYNELLQITQNANNIYTAASFPSLLTTVLTRLVKSFCQPLPNADTCSFCSGLCSCQTTCQCPRSCDDNNACTSDRCDPALSPVGTQGICVYTQKNCNDNNLCTSDSCNTLTGVCANTPIPCPGVPPQCKSFSCQPSIGPNNCATVDISTTQCPPLADKCQIRYCNTTIGCDTINKMNITAGQLVTRIDGAGTSYNIIGCARPSSAPACQVYSCDPTTGACIVDNSACTCIDDSTCQDGNGCSIDTCDTVNNRCVRVFRDCYSELSNGACSLNTPYTASTTTGLSVYNGDNNTLFNSVDSNGLPSPSTGVTRTCDQLGCYGGQPSTYTCTSQSEGSYQCIRSTSTCSRNGCQDNRCQTLGTWTNGDIDANCNNIFRPNCDDTSVCTVDYCLFSWNNTLPLSSRCVNEPINATQVCDDGNFCTLDVCDPKDTSGDYCRHILYGSEYVAANICTNPDNLTCVSATCTVNNCVYSPIVCSNPSLCDYFVCNSTTNNTCLRILTDIPYDDCGICGGDGSSCLGIITGTQTTVSTITAGAIAGSVIGAAAAAAAIIAGRKGYDKYQELAKEADGQVKNSGAYEGAGNGGDNPGLRVSAIQGE